MSLLNFGPRVSLGVFSAAKTRLPYLQGFAKASPSLILQKQVSLFSTTSPKLEQTNDSNPAHQSLKNAQGSFLDPNSEGYFQWNDFFKLRRQRRILEVCTAIPVTFIGMGATASYLSTVPLGNLITFNGVDPTFVVAGGVLLSGGLSYLLGGYLGGIIWRAVNRKNLKTIRAKEADYFEHISANRSDPRLSSYRNPLPDYYGEKISSVKGYRAWLKKQRRHERNGLANLSDTK
ncbi:hypothetical protein BB560_006084 [Smittium megazygosporum]|uniref:Presequence translocated-associated motor subunit PAM17 n=1 Tax=Smittium megazygosporum TaxID=133381 RepID=A0A2T9YID2_9FUNG|nr:hypothetical protein BB560_006084 [Smittium megazygosporum]